MICKYLTRHTIDIVPPNLQCMNDGSQLQVMNRVYSHGVLSDAKHKQSLYLPASRHIQYQYEKYHNILYKSLKLKEKLELEPWSRQS